MELFDARTEDLGRLYSEVLVDAADNEPGVHSPSTITMQLHVGKPGRELKPVQEDQVTLLELSNPQTTEGVDSKCSSVVFQLEYDQAHTDETPGESLAFVCQIPEGVGLGFRIPKRIHRPPFRMHHFQADGVPTWVVRFSNELNPQEIIPRTDPGIYSNRSMRSVDDMTHSGVQSGIDWSALGYKVCVFLFALGAASLRPLTVMLY